MKTNVPMDIIEQAADWFIRSQEETFTVREQAELEQWCQLSEEHLRAWMMAKGLKQTMQSLPHQVSKKVLSRSDQHKRRSVIKGLALMLAAPATVWLAAESLPLQRWRADFATVKGEQKQYMLADGSQLLLNTNSAVNINYTATTRRIILHQGELQLTSAKELVNRPLIVSTEFGDVEALGTVFQVQHQDDKTIVTVEQSAVEIRTGNQLVQQVKAGQSAQFNRQNISQPQAAEDSSTAWTKGQLIADNMRLEEVIAELSRYRQGWLQCDPEAANLRVSGVFQLQNTDIALQSLTKTLPVELAWRTRYWVTVRKNSAL